MSKLTQYAIKSLDQGIRDAVILLNNYGFETFESCNGEEGHSFPEPTIRFNGGEFDCIRAYELLEKYNYRVLAVKRVFIKNPLYDLHETKEIGENWIKPYNEITFTRNPIDNSILA